MLSATWVDKFASLDVPGAASQNRIGAANPSGTIPRWRALATLRWQNRVANAGVIARYVAPYEGVRVNPSTERKRRSQTSIDVQASLELGELERTRDLGRNVSVTMGVLNLFDAPPPFSAVGMDLGYGTSMSDLRQRFGYVRLEKRF